MKTLFVVTLIGMSFIFFSSCEKYCGEYLVDLACDNGIGRCDALYRNDCPSATAYECSDDETEVKFCGSTLSPGTCKIDEVHNSYRVRTYYDTNYTETEARRDCRSNGGTYAETVDPTPGTSIVFSNITATTMTVSWGVASDNVTIEANLQYKLVRSIENNISSVSGAQNRVP